MTTRRALTGFTRMKDDELVVQTTTIIQAMTGNEYFETPLPALTDVDAALEDFQTKLADARKKGSPFETSLKNYSKEALVEVLKSLAFYVNSIAKGLLHVLLSSGFPVSAVPVGGKVPLTPQLLKLRDGRQSGQIRLDFNKVEEARLYEYRYTSEKNIEGDFVWGDTFITSSSVSNIIAPVEPGKTYYVQVRAINGLGVGDWSDPVSLIAR